MLPTYRRLQRAACSVQESRWDDTPRVAAGVALEITKMGGAYLRLFPGRMMGGEIEMMIFMGGGRWMGDGRSRCYVIGHWEAIPISSCSFFFPCTRTAFVLSGRGA